MQNAGIYALHCICMQNTIQKVRQNVTFIHILHRFLHFAYAFAYYAAFCIGSCISRCIGSRSSCVLYKQMHRKLHNVLVYA